MKSVSSAFILILGTVSLFVPSTAAARPERTAHCSMSCRSPSLSGQTRDPTAHAWQTSPGGQLREDRECQRVNVYSKDHDPERTQNESFFIFVCLYFPPFPKKHSRVSSVSPLEGKAVPPERRETPGLLRGGEAVRRMGRHSRVAWIPRELCSGTVENQEKEQELNCIKKKKNTDPARLATCLTLCALWAEVRV